MAVHKAAQPPITFRTMRHEDLPAVLKIERQAFAQPWSRTFFEKELATSFARLVVAIDEGGKGRRQVAGYSCRWRVTDEVHVLNVAVRSELRGRGIGRLLVEAVIAESRATGVRAMSLEVRAGNVVARRLYRRLGFRDVGVRRGYYGAGQDAIVMALRLLAR